jgi:hypothetical protein
VLSRALRLKSRVLVGMVMTSIAVGAFALMSTPALASNTHLFSSSFGSEGSGVGQLSSPDGLAVNESTHDIYVADRGNHRVDEFSSSGSFVRAWGWGVADGLPALETCALVCGQGSSGSEAGQFTTPSFVAVDNSAGPSAGDVYVADTGDGLISKFTAEGALIGSWGTSGQLNGSTADKGPFGGLAGIAVGATGTLLAINESSILFKFTQDGTFSEDFEVERGTSANGLAVNAEGAFFKTDGSPNVEEETGAGGAGDVGQVTKSEVSGIAIDSANGDLYDVARNGAIGPAKSGAVEHFAVEEPGVFKEPHGSSCVVEPNTGCHATDAFGEGTLDEGTGVAVDPTNTNVYVADAATGTVNVYVPGLVQEVTTGEASAVTSSSATLHGSVNPEGTEVTECTIEYQAAGEPSTSVPCTPSTPYTGSSPVEVSTEVSGLSPGQPYDYAVVAKSANGTVRGGTNHFTALGPRILGGGALEPHLTSAVLSAQVNPDGEETQYLVEYGPTVAYGSSTTPVSIGSGEEPVALKVSLTGLQPDTTYQGRLVAMNGAATAYGSNFQFTTLAIVTGEHFAEVGTKGAAVSADIDAGGEPTTFRVEYGATNAYGSSTPPVSAGSAEDPVAVTARLGELEPNTAYHFRFVAENAVRTGVGPDLVLTTHAFSPAGLPDGRGYEMVTPANNQNAEVYVPFDAGGFTEDSIITQRPFEAAADGNAVTYLGGPTSGGNGAQGEGEGNQYVARRNAEDKWTQTNVQPPGYENPVYLAFSSNLQYGVLQSREPLGTGTPPSGYPDLYVHDNTAGASQSLIASTPPYRSGQEFGTAPHGGGEGNLGEGYAGASADFTHQLLEANDTLAPGAQGGPEATFAHENNLYDSFAGHLSTVNILPNGNAAPDAMFGGPVEAAPWQRNFSHVISADGARVFWTDLNTKALYVREHDSLTKLIAEEAVFSTASADGSRVLYIKAGTIYEDNLDTGVTRALAPGGGVIGLVGASEDLEYIYFASEAALAAGSTTGESNLYLVHGGEVRFIATLGSSSEEKIPNFFSEDLGAETLPWSADPGVRSAEVTPSGHALVFMSTRSLTGYDNVSLAYSEPVHEVFVYDADTGALSCASCDPSGTRPSTRGQAASIGEFFPISGYPTFQERVISEDGTRVFFESADPLLPQAQNGVLNVYEWERDGSGSCTLQNGCIYLLSTGSSSTPSNLIGASESGNDVFMITRSQLVPADQNEYNDVYDAHVGAVEPPAAPQCTGTGCQGVQAAPPVFATPASVTYAGVGNFSPSAVSTPVVKSKKKKRPSCTVKKKGKVTGKKSAKRAKAKPVPCKAKKHATHARTGKSGRGGR